MTLSRDPASLRTGPGPKAVTVSDLVVLVLGVALALSMTWRSRWWGHPAMTGIPRWRVMGEFIEEAIEKSCLALVPLALWRRCRLGGVCGPAELLLVACAAPTVAEDLDWAIWAIQGKYEVDDRGDHGDPFWWTRAVAGSACIAAVLGLFLGRDRIGDRARSALLMVVVAASFPWLLSPLDNIGAVAVEANQFEGWAEAAVIAACGAIKSLVPAILGWAAVLDLIRRRGRIGVLGWAGLILATVDLAVALPVNLWGYFMPSLPPLKDIQLHVEYFGGPIVAAILGPPIVLGLGPTWTRLFGPTGR